MTDPEIPPPSRPVDSSARAWGDVVLPLGLIAGVVVLLIIDPGAPGERMGDDPEGIEGWLHTAVHWLAAGAEIAAAAVIGWGVVQAFGTYALKVVRPGDGDAVNATEGLRVRLGRTLALGLEFTLASDILQTAVAPGRAEVILLGIIILLRTLLNMFLEREIDEIEAREAARARRDASAPRPVEAQ